jgi:hypothetical protein
MQEVKKWLTPLKTGLKILILTFLILNNKNFSCAQKEAASLFPSI